MYKRQVEAWSVSEALGAAAVPEHPESIATETIAVTASAHNVEFNFLFIIIILLKCVFLQ